jgi:hypothetical protein
MMREHRRTHVGLGLGVPFILWCGVSPNSFGAQSGGLAVGVRPVPAPALDAGVLQLATGLWLPSSSGMPGSDVIYNNTSACPYYQSMSPGEQWFDSGNLPSPTQPPFAAWTAGCATQYKITGFQFGYYTDQPTVDMRLRFIDRFRIDIQAEYGAVTTLDLPGLPGSSTPGTQVGWIVTVDLRGSGQEFVMMADGNGSFEDTNSDLFGYAMSVTNLVGTQTGALFAGAPSTGIIGTRWSRPVVDYGADGDGRLNSDSIAVTWPPNGGFSFNIHFCDGFYLRLYSDACGPLAGAPFCSGDGNGTLCPCSNSSPALNREGCTHAFNGVNGGRLEGTGMPSLSADSVQLTALRLPPNVSVLFFQGVTRTNGGLGDVFGDGLRCASGAVRRLGTRSASSIGEAAYPPAGGPTISMQGSIGSPGSRTYQAWYRNSAVYCTPSTFNLSNGWEIAWGV